jgi:hypothetical protein
MTTEQLYYATGIASNVLTILTCAYTIWTLRSWVSSTVKKALDDVKKVI